MSVDESFFFVLSISDVNMETFFAKDNKHGKEQILIERQEKNIKSIRINFKLLYSTAQTMTDIKIRISIQR